MNRDPIDSGFAIGVSKPENGRLGEDLSVADKTKGPPDVILRLHSSVHWGDHPAQSIPCHAFVMTAAISRASRLCFLLQILSAAEW